MNDVLCVCRRRAIMTVAPVLLAISGCSSDSDSHPDPSNEVAIQGVATGQGPADSGRPVATLVWSKGGGQILAARSAVRSEIELAEPRRYTLKLTESPPAEVVDAQGLAFAYIAAVRPDRTPQNAEEMAASIVGGSREFLLVYSQRDVASDSLMGKYLRGAVTAGYHLFKARAYTSEESAGISACKQTATGQGKNPEVECPAYRMFVSPAPNGFGEQVQVELDPVSRPRFPDLS
ncbi:hypothetical protein LVJ94_33500 [Pendulispora rubella]|uniref:Uncharacterized protein n=1 Tax=Pendulispora rubella TaxID=2741070 RepID=A0ABZ2KSZ4_9BACT